MIPVNGGPPMSKHVQRRGGRWGHLLSSGPLSSESESPTGGWGAGSPVAGSLGYPFLSQPLPHVQSLTQSLLTPNLCRACPSSEVLEFRVLHPSLPVPRSPQILLLFIRAVGKEFFFLRTHPCSSHCPPCLSLEHMCHHRGTGGAKRAPHPRQPKAVGRGDTAPFPCPLLIFNKDLFVTEVWPPAFLPQVAGCGGL